MEYLAGLSADQINAIATSAKKFQDAQEAINNAAKDEVDIRRQSLEAMKEMRQQALDALNDGSFKGFQNQMASLGQDIDGSGLTAASSASAIAMAQQIADLQMLRDTLAIGSPEFTRASAEIDVLNRNLSNLGSRAEAVKSSFSDGLSSILSGAESIQDVFKGMLDNFTMSIIDTFSQNVIDAVFGKALSGGIGAIFGFAQGGHVRGPGSGTSDSIMAMLSNGEFVVNAKAAQANLPLLEAMNNGDLPKFASGGQVGPVNNTAMKSSKVSGGSQTVVNLEITGDISRQTKKEVLRMIPQIAAGVNNANKERGRF
jgi:hypothetical protein